MKADLKTGLIHLIPVFASLLFGTFCAFLISMSSVEIYSVTPFPEGSGSFGNAFYFVILVGFGASLFYLLLRRKNRKMITLLTGIALTVAIYMLSVIYLDAAFVWLAIPSTNAALVFILGLSSLITAVAVFAVFRRHDVACNLIVLCLGGALGTFFGFAIPTLSAVLILGFLAVYDVFAVYRGPVGKIALIGLDNFRGLSFSFKDVQMGLGDLTFYSMLSGHMLLNFGVVSCAMSIAGILFGCLLVFRMLERKGMFPGLPFPIFFGLAAGLLVLLE